MMILDNKEQASVLGLQWMLNSDEFTFVVRTSEMDGKLTKRKMVYGAVVYVRVEQAGKQAENRLAISMVKVAPLKNSTIPRLESVAAKLLSQLVTEVKTAMEWSGCNITDRFNGDTPLDTENSTRFEDLCGKSSGDTSAHEIIPQIH